MASKVTGAELLALIDELGYRLCWKPCRLAFQWSRIWYRYRCPYPIIKDHSARACVEAGKCGCSNEPRYRVEKR